VGEGASVASGWRDFFISSIRKSRTTRSFGGTNLLEAYVMKMGIPSGSYCLSTLCSRPVRKSSRKSQSGMRATPVPDRHAARIISALLDEKLPETAMRCALPLRVKDQTLSTKGLEYSRQL